MDAHEDNLANRVASFSYYLKPGDQDNFVQKVNGHVIDHHDDPPLPANLSQQPPSYPIKSTKSSSANFFSQGLSGQDSSTTTLSNHHHHRSTVPSSFSPHPNDPQENIVFRVKAPIQDPNNAALAYSTHVERISSASNGEIGVFGADKYFNMRLDYDGAAMMIKKNIKHDENEGPIDDDVPVTKLNLRPGLAAPSIASEASSSWNSQAALLRNLSQKVSRARPRKASSSIRRWIFASFGCSGSCLDKGSVSMAEINPREEEAGGIIMANNEVGSRRLDHFAFPVLNNTNNSTTAQAMMKKTVVPLMDQDHRHHDQKILEEARKSLEVFGSVRLRNGDVATNLARKLSMLTWDAIPKSANIGSTTATNTVASTTTICDDMTSEASSDLFEIGDISGNGNGYSLLSAMEESIINATHHNHDGGNVAAGGGCMSPSTQYAPSEASIEWSVVTAAAADFSSVISDYDEKNIVGINSGEFIHNRNSRTKNYLEGREPQKGGRAGGLLGCKSQKTVNVAETVVHKTRVVEMY